MRIATPSSQWTCTTYSLPASRRTCRKTHEISVIVASNARALSSREGSIALTKADMGQKRRKRFAVRWWSCRMPQDERSPLVYPESNVSLSCR